MRNCVLNIAGGIELKSKAITIGSLSFVLDDSCWDTNSWIQSWAVAASTYKILEEAGNVLDSGQFEYG